LYSNARADALKELYKSKELDRDRPESIEADFEEVAASCGHFSFSLQDFANEMQTFLEILEELKEQTENRPRSWHWLRFWRKSKDQKIHKQAVDPEEENLIERNEETIVPKNPPEMIERRESRKWREIEPPQEIKQGLYRRILRVMRTLERDDGKLFLCYVRKYFNRLLGFSTLCSQSRDWSCTLCSLCFHPGDEALLSTLERRMGSTQLYACLHHNHRGF
jgi:hypothetical protein